MVGETLLTPPGEFREIETIDDAGRWGIELVGFSDQKIKMDPRTRYIVCINYWRWSDEEVWHEFKSWDFLASDEVAGWSSQQVPLEDADGYIEGVYVPFDELNVRGCRIAKTKDGEEEALLSVGSNQEQWWITKGLGYDKIVRKMMTLDPFTRLDQIAFAN